MRLEKIFLGFRIIWVSQGRDHEKKNDTKAPQYNSSKASLFFSFFLDGIGLVVLI